MLLRRFLSTSAAIRSHQAAIAQHFEKRIPEGDSLTRQVCVNCGFIKYENPLVVVGAIITHQEPGHPQPKILLCRRAIHPRHGKWTPPAGFMEKHETLEEGARRESQEEAGAEVEIGSLLGIYSIPHISQVHVFYRARLVPPASPGRPLFAAGPESLEVRLVHYEEIPWDELAFSVAKYALKWWKEHPGGHHVQQMTLPMIKMSEMK